jgi:hypothetical protein
MFEISNCQISSEHYKLIDISKIDVFQNVGPPITRSTAREYRDMLVALVGG